MGTLAGQRRSTRSGRGGCLVLAQPCAQDEACIHCGLRLGVEPALCCGAAHGLQLVGLLVGLDALGDHVAPQRLAHRHDGADQRRGLVTRASSRTNEPSIFSASTGKVRSTFSEECPVPKSSMCSRRPTLCSVSMIVRASVGSVMITDSVISMIRHSEGTPCSSRIDRMVGSSSGSQNWRWDRLMDTVTGRWSARQAALWAQTMSSTWRPSAVSYTHLRAHETRH